MGLAALKLGRLPHKFVQQNLNSIYQFASIFAKHVCGAAIAIIFIALLWCFRNPLDNLDIIRSNQPKAETTRSPGIFVGAYGIRPGVDAGFRQHDNEQAK